MLFLRKEINVKDENQDNLKIFYSIKEENLGNLKVYNLKVCTKNSKITKETIFIKGITDSSFIAKDIFNKLVKFSVTPTTLVNVLDDYFFEL